MTGMITMTDDKESQRIHEPSIKETTGAAKISRKILEGAKRIVENTRRVFRRSRKEAGRINTLDNPPVLGKDCVWSHETNTIYRCKNILHQNSYSTLFLSCKLHWCKKRALEKFKKDDLGALKTVEDIRRESEVLEKLHHRNVVKQFESWEDRTHIYRSLEYIEGLNLKDYTEKFGLQSGERIRCQIRDLLLSMKYLHEMGVAHRNLTPRHIMINRKGHIKIIDFSMAIILEKNEDGTFNPNIKNESKSTYGHIPPEFYNGRQTVNAFWADCWQLGFIITMLITGKYPFQDSNCRNGKQGKSIFFEIAQNVENFDGYHIFSDLAADLLRYYPQYRISAAEACEKYKWIWRITIPPRRPYGFKDLM